MTVTVRKLKIIPVPSYFAFYNVLHIIWVCSGHPYYMYAKMAKMVHKSLY